MAKKILLANSIVTWCKSERQKLPRIRCVIVFAILLSSMALFPCESYAYTQEVIDTKAETATVLNPDVLETEQRMKLIGALGATIISLLFVALGYFRLNHATQGFYSRRILIFAILISLLILLGCVIYLVPLFG